MEIKDLRIGNLLEWEDESRDIVEVVDIRKHGETYFIGFKDVKTGSTGSALWDEFIPVKATEQRLLKFGFEKEYESKFRKVFVLISNEVAFEYNFSKIEAEKHRFRVRGLDIDFKLAQHVHQLQNLCFALTNQELIFSPTYGNNN